MKRVFLTALALLMMLQTGCGGDSAQTKEPEITPPAQEGEQASEREDPVLILQDPWAFLGGSTLSEEQVATVEQKKLAFELEPEEDELALQYVELLKNGAYEVEEVEVVETVGDTGRAYACYFNYVGEGELPLLGVERNDCNLFIGIRRFDGDKTVFALYYPAGVGFADWGARAERPADRPELIPAVDAEPEATPEPSPEPEPEPEPVPPEEPEPAGPEDIPDFLENDSSGAFRAGTSAFDHAVCFLADDNIYYKAAEDYVQLLVDMGYQITGTDEKVKRTFNRMQWNLYHPDLDCPTIEEKTHVRVKHLAKDSEGKRSTEISIGYAIGITYGGEEQYGGGGGGGFSGGNWDPKEPDHAKLPCLTCGGSGDCKECGGYGYVGFGDARAACGRCHRSGNCVTCGGSGNR